MLRFTKALYCHKKWSNTVYWAVSAAGIILNQQLSEKEWKVGLMYLNQYHVEFYWRAAAISVSLIGLKDTEAQGGRGTGHRSHIIKVDKLAAGRGKARHL